MKTEQYITDLAGEFVDKINNLFSVSEENFLKIGMIIDSLDSKYVLSVADYELFFKTIMSRLFKPTLYEAQILSSRVAFYPIFMDLRPV